MADCSCSCDFTTSSWKDLKGHVEVYHGGRPGVWICAVCGTKNDDWKTCYEHSRYHHKFGTHDMRVTVVITENDVPDNSEHDDIAPD